jgi:endonuclease V-like protein UPF0215 family
MKRQVRVLGIDDAPFSFEDERVEIVGVVVRLPSYVEGVMVSEVAVDGEDATDKVAAMVLRSRFRENLALIMVDGVAFGGFNVVDIQEVHQRLHVPVATITKKEPDMGSIEKALRAKFSDWEGRMEVIRRSVLQRVETPHKPLYVYAVGMPMEEVTALIRRSTVRGALPEPLRIAHLIATAVKTGESKGSS